MTPEAFWEAIWNLGFQVVLEDRDDGPVARLHKLCHVGECAPKFREHFMGQEDLYEEAHLLSKRFSEITRMNCGHPPFLTPVVPPMPSPTH